MLLNHRLFHGYQGESTGTFKNYLSAARCSDQLLVTCTDGLCIDQDDSQERRGQLSPMETVYSEANEVSISTDQKITYIPNTSPMKLASRHHPMLYLSGSQPEECLLSRKAHLWRILLILKVALLPTVDYLVMYVLENFLSYVESNSVGNAQSPLDCLGSAKCDKERRKIEAGRKRIKSWKSSIGYSTCHEMKQRRKTIEGKI
jgi:hypothetical protein